MKHIVIFSGWLLGYVSKHANTNSHFIVTCCKTCSNINYNYDYSYSYVYQDTLLTVASQWICKSVFTLRIEITPSPTPRTKRLLNCFEVSTLTYFALVIEKHGNYIGIGLGVGKVNVNNYNAKNTSQRNICFVWRWVYVQHKEQKGDLFM